MPEATNPFEELRVAFEAAAAPFAEAMQKLAEDISRAFGFTAYDALMNDHVRAGQLAAVPGQVECEGKHGDENLPGMNALRRVGGWKCKRCGAAV